jgi:hypothetical protein
MIEETIVVSQGGQMLLPETWKPVYRMRYGKTTKYLKEYNILGFIKFYRLINEETVWDDYFVDYDTETGEIINKQNIKKIH